MLPVCHDAITQLELSAQAPPACTLDDVDIKRHHVARK